MGVLALSQYFQGAVLRVSCSSGMGVPTALGKEDRQHAHRARSFVCLSVVSPLFPFLFVVPILQWSFLFC